MRGGRKNHMITQSQAQAQVQIHTDKQIGRHEHTYTDVYLHKHTHIQGTEIVERDTCGSGATVEGSKEEPEA